MSTPWHERWEEGRIAFHLDEVNPQLKRHVSRLPKGRILVPLCGKSVDLWFLVQQGFEPTGVELVPKAVEQFFAEAATTPIVKTEGEATTFTGGGVTIKLGDFFALTHAPFDAVWDRAALIAIEPERRAEYVAHLSSLLRAGGVVLLVAIDYDRTKMIGPPHALSDAEITALFGNDFDAEHLGRNEARMPPRAAEEGLRGEESVWLLTKRE